MHRDPPRLPQEVERVRRGLPRPPAVALAHVRRALEVGGPERPALGDGLLDRVDECLLAARVTVALAKALGDLVHDGEPDRQVLRRDEARDVGQVFEQDAPAVDEPLEPRAVVRTEAAP